MYHCLVGNMGKGFDSYLIKKNIKLEDCEALISHYKKTWRFIEIHNIRTPVF